LTNLFTKSAEFPLVDATALKPRGGGIEERFDS
jgi:hypothetical protein